MDSKAANLQEENDAHVWAQRVERREKNHRRSVQTKDD
jgi:hypothetical protein